MVLGPGPVTEDELAQAASEVGMAVTPGSRLDVLLFQEAPAEAIVRQITSLWQGEVRQLGGAKYLAQVDDGVRGRVDREAGGRVDRDGGGRVEREAGGRVERGIGGRRLPSFFTSASASSVSSCGSGAG